MRNVWILLVLVAAAAAGESVDEILSDDAATRERAQRRILRAGTPILAELRKLHEAAEDDATRARLAALIRTIEEREPGGLRFHCGLPKQKLTLALVRSDAFRFRISVKNLSDKERILYPYLALRVLDGKGNPVRFSRHLGRGGRRAPGNPLEHIEFVTLKPGESWSFEDGIAQYMHDATWINGWQIPEAGTYTLEFTYAFDLAAAKRACDPDWKRLHAPDEPWNRAVAIRHTFSTTMKVE